MIRRPPRSTLFPYTTLSDLGPLIDWDPEIVETLDDDFKHETVFTLKDDEEGEDQDEDETDLDAILAEAQDENMEESDEEDKDWDTDEEYDDVPSLVDGMSNFSDEETGTKFTQYSMSSSVIRRNEQLTLLDDQFEKFYDDYDDENLGGCEMDELEGHQTEDSLIMKQMVQKFAEESKLKTYEVDVEKFKYVPTDDGKVDEVIIEEENTQEEDSFDCESIISTYSNIYNHPKLISEPSIKKIMCGKNGIPKNVLGKGLTSAALKELDRLNCQQEIIPEEDDAVTLASRVSEISFRNKHESKEEKKMRKNAVKELKRDRRAHV